MRSGPLNEVEIVAVGDGVMGMEAVSEVWRIAVAAARAVHLDLF